MNGKVDPGKKTFLYNNIALELIIIHISKPSIIIIDILTQSVHIIGQYSVHSRLADQV